MDTLPPPTDDTMARFTAWLSALERQALDQVAKDQHMSVNLIVRMAIRNYAPVREKLSR